MKEITQTQQEIVRYLERRDRRLKDGMALPHIVFFLDLRIQDKMTEAFEALIARYDFIGLA